MRLRWKKCLTEPQQLLKLIIFIGCVCFSLFQLAECINKLLHPPISSYYRFYLNDTFRYPSVTICRRPSFKYDLFPKYGMPDYIRNLLTFYAFYHFDFENYTIEEFLNETTYTFDEVFGAYSYAGLGNSLEQLDIVSFQTIRDGLCHTLNPKTESSIFAINGGYFFYLNHDIALKTTDSYGVSHSGFRVYVHDSNEVLTSEFSQDNNFFEELYLESAEDMRVILKVQEYNKISTSENPCVANRPNYSRSRCQERCLHEQIANAVGCTLPWLNLRRKTDLPQCRSFETVSRLISGFNDVNRTFYMRNCNCLLSCNVTMYSTQIISRREIEERNAPDSIIILYSTSNLVTLMNELAGYDWNQFVADIGGSFGFLLGLSVIGLIGIIEQIFSIIFKRWFSKGKENTTEDTNDNDDNKKQENENQYDMVEEKVNNKSRVINSGNFCTSSKEIHTYRNLRDYSSSDFKYYETTLVGKPELSRF